MLVRLKMVKKRHLANKQGGMVALCDTVYKGAPRAIKFAGPKSLCEPIPAEMAYELCHKYKGILEVCNDDGALMEDAKAMPVAKNKMVSKSNNK